ncbi:hypothetical protein DPV83_00730 [Aggregatibacter segnis]|uniref:Uncharacterized protein n=1 Tax=Aggregatibacter segnis TaxID=739 RepID=A0A8B2U4K0_9PAST|nr:hypothetical protein DPV83_00730 [Aggregatibacter segnis]
MRKNLRTKKRPFAQRSKGASLYHCYVWEYRKNRGIKAPAKNHGVIFSEQDSVALLNPNK